MARTKYKTPKIHFHLTTETGHVSMFFSYRYRRFNFGTGIVVPPEDWDKTKQRAKSHIIGRHNYTLFNTVLQQWEDVARQSYIDLDYGEVPQYRLRDEILQRMGRMERPETLPSKIVPYLKKYVVTLKTKIGKTKAHWGKYDALATHIENYQDEKGKELAFKDVDWPFKQDFEDWLYQPPRSFSQNNVSKLFSSLKMIMKDAHRHKIHENEIYKEKGFGVKPIATRNKVRFTIEELKAIQAHDFTGNDRLERTRDLLIFACWSGLRYSDWRSVAREKVRTIEGSEFIEIVTAKTKTKVFIPLIPPLLAVLEKYHWQLPEISNQKFNEYAKEVVKAAIPNATFARVYSKAGQRREELAFKWEFTSSHAGRRTYATNAYKISGNALQVMSVTGHATEAQFFAYIDEKAEKLAIGLSDILNRHFE